MRCARRAVLVAVSLPLLSVGPALAQSNQEINAGVQFSFAPPGARSMGLGGAFMGLADDATAAYANPAGLTVLTKPELSFEGRYSKFTSLYTDKGSQPPRSPTGSGVDTVSGLVDGSLDDSLASPGFVSFVYPKGRVAVALFRHELVNYKASIASNGAYYDQGADEYRFYPAKGTLDLDIVDYGLGIGVQLSKQFSAGLGLSLFDFSLASRTDRYDINGGVRPWTTSGAFYGTPDYSSGNLFNYQTQDGSGTTFAVSAGLLWKPTSKVQLGAVYRQGPDFADKVTVTYNPGPKSSSTAETTTSGFKVPDAFGAGAAVKPTDQLTVTLDVLRVLHSQRLDHFVNTFDKTLSLAGQFEVNDGTELHFGAEYVFSGMKYPLAVRAGGWVEPESRIRYTGDVNSADLGNNSVTFRKGESYAHGTFGLGWVFGSQFQLDLATDLSSRTKIVTASAVYRF